MVGGLACGCGHRREVGISKLAFLGAKAPKSYWCNKSEVHLCAKDKLQKDVHERLSSTF